jgi:hypothetical protein
MLQDISQASVNTILIAVSGVLLATTAYFLKRVMDCLDIMEKTQGVDGNRITALEAQFDQAFATPPRRRRDDPRRHHTSGPQAQES